ncbi:MAG: hypothetical protein ACE5KQ_02015 [Thermoplasmata archaeon]
MANLLAHALFALALFSVPSSVLLGAPLSGYGFVAALASLAPDLEGACGRRRTPHGHSFAFLLLWALLALSALSLAGWLGILPVATLPILLGACFTGVASHLFLDVLEEPGIFTWPQAGGEWGRFTLLDGRRASEGSPLVSSLSIATILALLILY